MRIGIDLTACWRARVGMVTVSLELARAIIAQAPGEVVVLASRERPEGIGEAETILTTHRHEVVVKAAWMAAVESDAGLDAILYPYWPSPPFRRRGAPPATIFVHDLAFQVRAGEVPWQQRVYLGRVLPRALAGAAAVITPSETTRRDLLSLFSPPGLADRVEVVPEGPTSLPAAGDLPAGLEPGFLLAVGTVEPRKNYPRLVEAYRILKADGPAPALVVAGRPGWAYGDALRLLREEPGVALLGHVDDATLAALLRDAVALAFPSLYEGFGLPLLDAMAAGLPAVIGDAGSLPELAAGAAVLVDARDPAAIAAGLRRLLQEPALRRQLSERGRLRARDFSWDRAAATVLEVVRRTAGGRATAASRMRPL
ncbi:MAG: glycosyltransferase family 4 protein [Candidatus Dormibacteraceae bacterium]